MASPIFFNVYIDELFNILKKSGLGCTINNFYYGLLGYADDGALVAPSRLALQKMLDICQSYFDAHGIQISVCDIVEKSKTKCLAFNTKSVPASIILYGKPLPWVDFHSHLGHIIHKDQCTSHDLYSKRGEFISKVHSLRQELGDQEPEVFLKLVNIYFNSFYGSNLWDLFGAAANKVYTSWNVLIRDTFKLPYGTHRYILQDIDHNTHIRICLLRRFVKFYSHLKNSIKPEVRNLLETQKSDYRSTFGKNCLYLCKELKVSQMEEINSVNIGMIIKTPPTEQWRIAVLREKLDLRNGQYYGGQANNVVNALIDYLCRN